MEVDDPDKVGQWDESGEQGRLNDKGGVNIQFRKTVPRHGSRKVTIFRGLE